MTSDDALTQKHDAGSTRPSELARLETGCALEAALAFFDHCPAVTCEEMLGSWRGSGMPTGHPMDGLLEATGWHGKRFVDADDVHPLVYDGPGGNLVDVNPQSRANADDARHAGKNVGGERDRASAHARCVAAHADVEAHGAVRIMEYRGVVTATMSYDARPINDHFRRVDADTMLGAMNLRGTPPFFFVLRREG